MIRFSSRGALVGEVWFDEDPPANSDVDIIAYRQRSTPVEDCASRACLSIVNDLDGPTESIIESFGKNCRYKVRRAKRRDGLSLVFVPDPSKELSGFLRFYDAFARSKGLRRADRRWLHGVCDAGRFVLASAIANNETLVMHGYVVSKQTAWLQYSASHYQEGDSERRGLIARANRWLHWQSMLRFKELGLSCYDWGGLFENESTPERAGINRFKKEFGGRLVRRYECMSAITFKGQLRILLKRVVDIGRGVAANVRRSEAAADRCAPRSPSGPKYERRSVSPELTRKS